MAMKAMNPLKEDTIKTGKVVKTLVRIRRKEERVRKTTKRTLVTEALAP